MGRIGTPCLPLFGINNGTLLSSRDSAMCGRGIAHSNEKEQGIAVLGSMDGPETTLSDRHAHCMREVIVSQVDRQVSRLRKLYAFEYNTQ